MKIKLARSAPRIVRAALFFALAQTLPSAALAQAASQANSLAEAYRIIASKQFVDLTHSFGPLTPVWKGFGPATFSAASDPETGRPYTIEKDGFRVFSTRWSGSMARTSTRPRISTPAAGRWTKFRSSR